MTRGRTIEFFCDLRGKWRWRERARNGNITAEGGQGYASLSGAMKEFKRHRESLTVGEFKVMNLITGQEVELYAAPQA